MNAKDKLMQLLEDQDGEFLSEASIADDLGMTKAAVREIIRTLEMDGFEVDAVENRGYRLGALSDAVTANSIRKYLGEDADKFSFEVFDVIPSTNSYLKEHAAQLPAWHTAIAGRQTAGKGRMGRNFFSPANTGLYMSILLRPDVPAAQAVRITTAAAVSACQAIEETTDSVPSIKWVNDVFVNGRKICGILTEGSLSIKTGGFDWAVMGIGFNVYEPEGGFPPEIADIAGPVSDHRTRDLRSRLAAAFLKHFYDLCSDLSQAKFSEEYRKRSFLPGQPIQVLKTGDSVPATALDIDEECHLIVAYADGTTEALSSGEVSVRPLKTEQRPDNLF